MGTAKKVGIGVVGGQMGASFQWHLHPGSAVTAVADLNAASRQKLKETYGCDNVYDSLEELVEDKTVDAVALFTEAPAHVDHTIEAMKHGKHVICAVPAFAGSIDEAERLLDAVKTYGLTYMMAEASYYQDLTISARKFYEEGKFASCPTTISGAATPRSACETPSAISARARLISPWMSCLSARGICGCVG
ncbi:MAG: Gfo/Idh/MocA family oxidoreductase, partial [Planctomycetota bacterium]